MKPSELFDVVVRTIGLLVVLAASAVLFYAAINLVLGGPASVVGLVILGVPPLLVGLWLLNGCSGLADVLYRDGSDRDEQP